MLINFTVIIFAENTHILFLVANDNERLLFYKAFAETKIIVLQRLVFFTAHVAQISRRECERITMAQHVTQNRCVYRRSLMFVCLFSFFFPRGHMLFTLRGVAKTERAA